MNARTGWLGVATALSLVIVGATVYVVGKQVADPEGRREGDGAPVAALADSVPEGQPPVQSLTVQRFQEVFDEADDRTRLLVMLSPT